MKKYLLITLLVITVLGLAGSAWATTTIIKDYPAIGGISPQEEGITLPHLIKYIFLFALGVVGIVGLLAIIIGAFGYLTAVGNPQKATAAKDKIISALLGLLLLLGSYLLLNIINPDLLKLKVEAPAIDPENTVQKSYACYCCCSSIFGKNCDPFSKPEYRRWCTFGTLYKVNKECRDDCKFYQCSFSNITGYVSQISEESCN